MEILWFEQANEKVKEAKTVGEADQIISEYFSIVSSPQSICLTCKYYNECLVTLYFRNPIMACRYYRGGKK